MASDKTAAEKLKAALIEEHVAELCLKDYSLRHIMREVGLKHPEEVSRIIKKLEKRWESESAETAKLMLKKDLERLKMIASEAWQAWARSIGRKQKKTEEVKGVVQKEKAKGRGKARHQADDEPDLEDELQAQLQQQLEAQLDDLNKLSEHKTKTISWHEAGDPRFLKIAMDCIVERNRLLGTYDKTEDDEDPLEAVRFLQDIYIPGIGMLTQDLLVQLMKDAPPMPGDPPRG